MSPVLFFFPGISYEPRVLKAEWIQVKCSAKYVMGNAGTLRIYPPSGGDGLIPLSYVIEL